MSNIVNEYLECKKSVQGICKAGKKYKILSEFKERQEYLIEYSSLKRRAFVGVSNFSSITDLRKEKLLRIQKLSSP